MSADALAAALAKLPPRELDRILDRVRSQRARTAAPRLTPEETALLGRINAALSDTDLRELKTLGRKMEAGSLSADEHERLTALTDRMEEMQADRIRAVAETAAARSVSFRELWEQLGLGQPADA